MIEMSVLQFSLGILGFVFTLLVLAYGWASYWKGRYEALYRLAYGRSSYWKGRYESTHKEALAAEELAENLKQECHYWRHLNDKDAAEFADQLR